MPGRSLRQPDPAQQVGVTGGRVQAVEFPVGRNESQEHGAVRIRFNGIITLIDPAAPILNECNRLFSTLIRLKN